MEEHQKPPLPSADSSDLRPATIIPPLPSGFLWLQIPIKYWLMITITLGLLYISTPIGYICSISYPLQINPVDLVFGIPFLVIFTSPLVIPIYLVSVGTPHLLLKGIYSLRFKASLPKKTYLIEFIPVLLLICVLTGYTIHDNIGKPVKSLQKYVMNGDQLPSSVKNVNYYYCHSPFGGSIFGWSFEIEPADLPKILQTKKFACETKSEGFNFESLFAYKELPDTAKPQNDPMIHRYYIPDENPDKDSPIFRHFPLFTNKTNSRVIIVRQYLH